MFTNLFAVSDNFIEGLKVGGKLIGAIVASALILYLVLFFTRITGKKINSALYKKYTEKYLKEMGNDEGIMTFDEFVKSKSETKIIENPNINNPTKIDKESASFTNNTAENDNSQNDDIKEQDKKIKEEADSQDIPVDKSNN